MPITTEIKQRLTGGPSNTDPAASLGGEESSTDVVDNTDNNIFADSSGDETLAGSIKYRCIAVVNTHGSLTLISPKVWITSNTPSTDDTIAIGLGTSGVGTSDEQTIANEDTAPSGVSFSSPTTKVGGLAPANVPAGSHFFIWERRTITGPGSAYTANAYTVKAEGDSAA